MRIAYGYKVLPEVFAKHNPDNTLIDTKETRRAVRSQMFETGLRAGEDTLLLTTWASLARGGELPAFKAGLKEMNIPVEIVGLPEAPVRPRGRPNGTKLTKLPADKDMALRAMWADPLHYTTQACIDFAASEFKLLGMTGAPTRHQMNYRYGTRT